MASLRYRAGVEPHELALGECTVRRTMDEHGSYWHLWFFVNDNAGVGLIAGVPVGRAHVGVTGSGGWNSPRLTWALFYESPGVWQVSPSIKVSRETELWHQTPTIVDVPTPAPWEVG